MHGSNQTMARGQIYKVLVVEDQAIIGLDLQVSIEAAGYLVTGIAPTVDAAIAQMEASRPDAVLLDVGMGGEPDFALADLLAERAIPFVFVTGYTRDSIPSKHKARPIVMKPCMAAQLLTALKTVIQHRDDSAVMRSIMANGVQPPELAD